MRRRVRNAVLSVVLVGLLVALTILIGESASANAADVIIGVVFGVATAVPLGLLVALILRERTSRPRVTHHHDNRQVIVYLQHADGSLERLDEAQARQIAAPLNGVVKVTR